MHVLLAITSTNKSSLLLGVVACAAAFVGTVYKDSDVL